MASDDELRDAMARAMAGLAAVVAEIEPDEWGRPSMCEGWSITDVVEHVVGGDRFASVILGGGSYDDGVAAVMGVDHLGDDAHAEALSAAAATRTSFAGSLDRIVDHPVGEIPARRFIGFRVLDQLGHTWDVGHALGRTPTLDDVAVAVALEIAASEEKMLETSRHFVSLDVEIGDAQTTFLQTIGRSPGK